MPDALQFAFESMKIGTIAEKAALLIDEIPVSGFCEKCKSKFTVNDVYIVACPNCGHFPVRIESGRELNIDEMEVF